MTTITVEDLHARIDYLKSDHFDLTIDEYDDEYTFYYVCDGDEFTAMVSGELIQINEDGNVIVGGMAFTPMIRTKVNLLN